MCCVLSGKLNFTFKRTRSLSVLKLNMGYCLRHVTKGSHSLLFKLLILGMFGASCVAFLLFIPVDTHSSADRPPLPYLSWISYSSVKDHVQDQHKQKRALNDDRRVIVMNADTKAVKIECPSIIQDGYPISITCTINKTDPVLQSCLSKNTRISITHNIALYNKTITLCTVPFDSPNCSSKKNTLECKCSRNTDDTFQYSYEYQVNKKRDKNSSFRCDQICPGENVTVEFSSCTSIKIKENVFRTRVNMLEDRNGGISSSRLHTLTFLWLAIILSWSNAYGI